VRKINESKIEKNGLKYTLTQVTFVTNLIDVFNCEEPLSLCMNHVQYESKTGAVA